MGNISPSPPSLARCMDGSDKESTKDDAIEHLVQARDELEHQVKINKELLRELRRENESLVAASEMGSAVSFRDEDANHQNPTGIDISDYKNTYSKLERNSSKDHERIAELEVLLREAIDKKNNSERNLKLKEMEVALLKTRTAELERMLLQQQSHGQKLESTIEQLMENKKQLIRALEDARNTSSPSPFRSASSDSVRIFESPVSIARLSSDSLYAEGFDDDAGPMEKAVGRNNDAHIETVSAFLRSISEDSTSADMPHSPSSSPGDKRESLQIMASTPKNIPKGKFTRFRP
jgi:chromosome segregation ATPase